MYILIREDYVTNEEIRARYHKRLPDGRLIITPQELKMLGSVPECQIAATKLEVDSIIDEQTKNGVKPMESLKPAMPATPEEDVADEPTETDDADNGETDTDGTADTGDSESTDETPSETTDNTEGETVAEDSGNEDSVEWEKLNFRKEHEG